MAKWVALLLAALLCVGELARVHGQPLTAVASPKLHQGSQEINEPIHREKRGLILGGLVLGGLVGAGAAGVVGAKVFGGSFLAGKALGYGHGRSYGYGGYGGYGYGYGGYPGYGYGGWRSYSGPYYSYYW